MQPLVGLSSSSNFTIASLGRHINCYNALRLANIVGACRAVSDLINSNGEGNPQLTCINMVAGILDVASHVTAAAFLPKTNRIANKITAFLQPFGMLKVGSNLVSASNPVILGDMIVHGFSEVYLHTTNFVVAISNA